MPNDPEKELQEFLASKPEWLQTHLQEGDSKLTFQEKLRLDKRKDKYEIDTHERITELTDQYQQILCQIPELWKPYRARIMREYGNTFGPMMLPKGKPGRKKNVKGAERIWTLHDAGKTSSEIQKILEAEGQNYSLNGVESYLKTRRRT